MCYDSVCIMRSPFDDIMYVVYVFVFYLMHSVCVIDYT